MRALPLLILMLSLGLTTAAQGFLPGGTVVVTADRTELISGETMQLLAQVRDSQGNTTPNETLSWSSSDPTVLSVDNNGVVSALRLGTAIVTVAGTGRRATLGMQVLPDHIEVIPARSEMYVGDQLQFTATAFDINRNPIPNTLFDWALVNSGGFFSRDGSISANVLLNARAVGPVTVKANVRYFTANQSEVDRSTGTAQVVIKSKKDFRLSPLLATTPVQRSFRLRTTPWTHMASNDRGQIAFVASLDGLTAALMLYDETGISVLASAGVPGPMPGSFVWDFGPPAINNRGDVITHADVRGNASGLLLANRNGTNYIVIDGQSVGGFARLSNFTTTRYSINDNGEVLFTAGFQDLSAKTPTWNTGLFKYNSHGIQPLVTTADTLPGLGTNFQIGYFGIDRNGVAYFGAFKGDATALYRADGGAPQKIAATGDPLAGSTIMSLNVYSAFGLSNDGTLGYGANLKDGAAVVVQYRSWYGQRTKRVNWLIQVYAIGPDGDVYFSGGTADASGVLRWRSDEVLIGLRSNATIDAATVLNLADAFVTASNDLYVLVSTSATGFALVQAATSRVLFKEGMSVNATANVDFLNLVQGGHTGTPHLLTGGNDPSVYEWNTNELTPDYVAGSTAALSNPRNTVNAIRASSGDLYTTTDSTIFHHVNGHADTVLQLPLTIGTVNLQSIAGWYESANSIGVNANGVIAFTAWADTGSVLCTWDGGRTTILAQLGGSTPTASPASGTFSDWLQYMGPGVAIDDRGRVMIGAQVQAGKSGLFLFENGQWRTAALINTTQIDGDTVRNVNTFRAAGQNFFANFATDNGGWIVAQYDGGNWKSLVKRGDLMPNGSTIYYLNNLDVNRQGDVAFVAQIGGGSMIALHTADGTYHIAHLTSEPTDAGDLFPYYRFSLNLQDDRSLYFTGIDILDRNLLYLAQPLF